MPLERIGIVALFFVYLMGLLSCSKPETSKPPEISKPPETYEGVWTGEARKDDHTLLAVQISSNKFPCKGTITFEFGEKLRIQSQAALSWEEEGEQLIGVGEFKQKDGSTTKAVLARARLSNGTLSGEFSPHWKDKKITIIFSQFQKTAPPL